MYTEDLVVKNKTGFHARPASQLTKFAQQFKSEVMVFIEEGAKEVNLKSVISILSAQIKQGTEIELRVSGPDEETAGPALVEFINSLTE